MRINARLEELSSTQLDFLVTRLGLSVSEVLRQGLDLLYKQQTAQAGQPLRHFSRHVGRYHSGEGNLSVNYKAELGAALNAKWPRPTPMIAASMFAKSEPLVFEVRQPDAPPYGAKRLPATAVLPAVFANSEAVRQTVKPTVKPTSKPPRRTRKAAP